MFTGNGIISLATVVILHLCMLSNYDLWFKDILDNESLFSKIIKLYIQQMRLVLRAQQYNLKVYFLIICFMQHKPKYKIGINDEKVTLQFLDPKLGN